MTAGPDEVRVSDSYPVAGLLVPLQCHAVFADFRNSGQICACCLMAEGASEPGYRLMIRSCTLPESISDRTSSGFSQTQHDPAIHGILLPDWGGRETIVPPEASANYPDRNQSILVFEDLEFADGGKGVEGRMTITNQNNLATRTAADLWATVIFFITGFASIALAQDTTDYLGASGPLSFQGEDYVLAWSSQASPDYITQEYLPTDQNRDNYTDMLLVERLSILDNAEAVAAQIVDMLDKRKTTDPIVSYAILRNEAQSELILDFVLSSQTPEGEPIIEWNAYRYTQLSDDAPGILLLGISRRAYGGADVRTFIEELGTRRDEAIKALTTMTIPQLTR